MGEGRTLLLGLGNDLLTDDAAGLLAVRLAGRLADETVDVVETSACGIALLEHFLGYDRAVVVDTIRTGRRAPGTVVEVGVQELGTVLAPSPHYAGLPEMLAVARALRLPFPQEVRILALEALDPFTVGTRLTEPVRRAIPHLAARILTLLESPEARGRRPAPRQSTRMRARVRTPQQATPLPHGGKPCRH